MQAIQRFPAVNIEALGNGLFRLEDESGIDGPQIIDIHPAQVQVLASMVGFAMPDKSRRALARLSRRLATLHKQAKELEGQLVSCVVEHNIGVAPELTAAEFIVASLGEVLEDLEAIQAPDLEPMANTPANPGGQLTLPV